MNLLLFNVNTDLDHPTQAFTTTWIRGLAAQFDHVTVLCLRAGRIDVPNNVTVHGLVHGASFSRQRFLKNFYTQLSTILHTEKIDVCFSHMNVYFAILAWPLLRLRQIPILLWYGHRATPLPLRIAHALVNGVVTSAPNAFRLRSKKTTVIGQGVDTKHFAFRSPQNLTTPTIVTIGRISPIKRLDDLIRAANILVREHGITNLRVRIVGKPGTDEQVEYENVLRRLVQELDLTDVVSFDGAVPFEHAPALYTNATASYNGCPDGAPDKAGFEAMSSGVPTVVRNRSYRSVLSPNDEWLLVDDSLKGIASAYQRIFGLSEPDLSAIGMRLRERVESHHGVGHATEQIVNILRTFKHDT